MHVTDRSYQARPAGPLTLPSLGALAGHVLNPKSYDLLIRATIGLLIVSLCLWMLVGIVQIVADLYGVLRDPWAARVEHMIVTVLAMLAVLEVIRTLQSYLEFGRVRVTFILDAALVVLIGELIGLWFKAYSAVEVLLSLGVIAVLTVLRIVTTRYSPDHRTEGGR